jgi:hypothetical protein
VNKISKKKYRKIIRKSKRRIEDRLGKRQWKDQREPIMKGSNIHYEMSEKAGGISSGGIGVCHQMVKRIGLEKDINTNLKLLKVHIPYHESDHVLNIAYNILAVGMRLEDIELRRKDEAFLNALGAQRIPDPTTAGDFTRRFDREDIGILMESINRTRQRVWAEGGAGRLEEGR